MRVTQRGISIAFQSHTTKLFPPTDTYTGSYALVLRPCDQRNPGISGSADAAHRRALLSEAGSAYGLLSEDALSPDVQATPFSVTWPATSTPASSLLPHREGRSITRGQDC